MIQLLVKFSHDLVFQVAAQRLAAVFRFLQELHRIGHGASGSCWVPGNSPKKREAAMKFTGKTSGNALILGVYPGLHHAKVLAWEKNEMIVRYSRISATFGSLQKSQLWVPSRWNHDSSTSQLHFLRWDKYLRRNNYAKYLKELPTSKECSQVSSWRSPSPGTGAGTLRRSALPLCQLWSWRPRRLRVWRVRSRGRWGRLGVGGGEGGGGGREFQVVVRLGIRWKILSTGWMKKPERVRLRKLR